MNEARRTVKLARSEYQPSKAEPEGSIDIRREGGTQPTPEELARAALRPVDIKWKDRP